MDAALDPPTFDYLTKQGVPELVDSICRHLMTTKPPNPTQSVIEFLNASRGGYRGGVAIAGQSVGGGWLRMYDGHGNLIGKVDKIPAQAERVGTHLASNPNANFVFLAITPKTEEGEATSSEIRKYSLDGTLMDRIAVPKVVSAIAVERERGHLWVLCKGGGAFVYQNNGSKLRDLPLPAASSIVFQEKYFWLLTPKALEKREVDSAALELAVHLPDTMLHTTASLTVSSGLVWCTSYNPDGSANYFSVFDLCGRPVSVVPPQGSVLAFDRSRGGMWVVPKHGSGQLVFMNERGTRLITSELGKARNVNIATDAGSSLIWCFRTEEGNSRLGAFNPLQGSFRCDNTMPDTMYPTTHMALL